MFLYTNVDDVLCFHYSHVSVVNSTYHVPTCRRTYASSTMSQHSGTETKTSSNCRVQSTPTHL